MRAKKQKKKPILREKLSVYLGPPPKASSEHVSKSMKSNRAKGTKPELLFRKALFAAGIRGYRLNWPNIPGSPDIGFVGRKIAIFVNGCYWHRCPKCNLPLPKTNKDFWEKKFLRNIERDKLKRERLQKLGWKVVTIWECEIKKDTTEAVTKVKKALNLI